MGDFVKGPLTGQHPQAVERGIQLHRNIDGFTDQNPCVKQCQLHFAPRFRRYSGIMTDVVFDHFLSIHWHQFHPEPLETFSAEVFSSLDNSAELTDPARALADGLRRHDVFQRYRQWPMMATALESISQRLRGQNPLAQAAGELSLHYDRLELTFFEFYPQLQQFCQRQRGQFSDETIDA
jgi:acyl carrier protein phosphodiesterase